MIVAPVEGAGSDPARELAREPALWVQAAVPSR